MQIALVIVLAIYVVTILVLWRRRSRISKQAAYHLERADHLANRTSELHEELRKAANSLEAQKALGELGQKALDNANWRRETEVAAHTNDRKQLQEAKACIEAYKAVQHDHLEQVATLQDENERYAGAVRSAHQLTGVAHEQNAAQEKQIADLKIKIASLESKKPKKLAPGTLYGGSRRTPKK